MELTSDFVSFVTRYARTALDLVLFLGPKRFVEAARARTDNHYLEPLTFLFVSLGVSTVVGFTIASIVLQGDELAALGRIGIIGTAVIIAGMWMVNFFLVFFGKAVAILLGLELSMQQMVDAYCYASIFFPFFVAANMAAFGTYSEPQVAPVLFAMGVQILFVSFLITIMARIAQFAQPKFAVFVVGTPFALFGISALLGWAVAVIEHNPASQNPRTAEQIVRVVGEGAQDLATCTSAMLYGTVDPKGVTTTAWFEWGLDSTSLAYTTPDQTFSRKSEYSQVLMALPPTTTFYWRSVAWNAHGSALGTISSFTTPQCTS